MTDDPFYAPNRAPLPPRLPSQASCCSSSCANQIGRIFGARLRFNGESYGIEAPFYRNEEFEIGRRFDRTMNPTRPPRDLSIAWAEQWRKAIQCAGLPPIPRTAGP